MTVSVVVPVWNGKLDLERLLDSLAGQTYQACETILVDNGSTDGAADLGVQWGATVVRFAANRGFAAAVNRGIAESKGELLAVLNSDVVLAPDWTECLVGVLAHQDAGFATGMILCAANPELIDGSWDLVSHAGMPWRAGSGYPASTVAFVTDRSIGLAPFTAILIKRAMWDEIGPLDERFESYLEDVDFGLRCLQSGRAGWYTATAVCTHRGSATLGRWHRETVRRMSRNQVFLIQKYRLWKAHWWKVVIGQALWGLLAVKHGAGWAWCRGKFEGWQRRGEFVSPGWLDEGFLAAQEREIFTLQAKYEFDSYWKWYRRFTEAE